MKFYPKFPHLLSYVGEIRYKEAAPKPRRQTPYKVQQARGEILPKRRREPEICQLLVGCALSKYEDPSVSGTWVKSCRLPSESDESK